MHDLTGLYMRAGWYGHGHDTKLPILSGCVCVVCRNTSVRLADSFPQHLHLKASFDPEVIKNTHKIDRNPQLVILQSSEPRNSIVKYLSHNSLRFFTTKANCDRNSV